MTKKIRSQSFFDGFVVIKTDFCGINNKNCDNNRMCYTTTILLSKNKLLFIVCLIFEIFCVIETNKDSIKMKINFIKLVNLMNKRNY